MDGYDKFKRDIALELAKIGVCDQKIMDAIDTAAKRYRVEVRDAGACDNSSILEEYIASCEYEKMAAGTVENYRLVVGRMLDVINLPVNEIRASDLRSYLRKYQDERGVSDRTINKYREYIRSFFGWCVSDGCCASNPAAKMKPVRVEKKQAECFTQSELERIRSACSDMRDTALVEVLYSTGCRVSELCRLKQSDIDWQNRTVKLYGKGRKERIGYLNAKAEVHLKRYLDSRSDQEDWLFISKRGNHGMTPAGIQKILRQIQERIGSDFGKPVTPHMFRRTTATNAMQHGMPVEDIQALLGHENIETTMVYARTCNENVRYHHQKCIV